jgi:host factor-I protein
VNGVPIKGRVLSFDNFTILMEVDKKQNLIYKHAISTFVPTKPIPYREETED